MVDSIKFFESERALRGVTFSMKLVFCCLLK